MFGPGLNSDCPLALSTSLAKCTVFCPTGSHHSNPTEAWAASAQASNAASQTRVTSAYMGSPQAQSLTLPSTANTAATYPMMNGGVISSVHTYIAN